MRNVIEQVKVVKMLSLIDLDSKYIWAISNADINDARDLELTIVKKYWRRAGRIKNKMNGLYKNQISTLSIFIKHFWRIHSN